MWANYTLLKEMCSLLYLNKTTCLLQKFNQNTDFRKNSEFQIVLIRHRAQLNKCTNHPSIYILPAFFIPLCPYFPHLLLPKSPKSLPVSSLVPAQNPTTIVWSQDALPLHPIMCPITRQQPLSVWKVVWRPTPNESSWWILCLDTGTGALWGQPSALWDITPSAN